MTAMETYLASVKHLPAIERLRLALLILNDLTPADLAKGREQPNGGDAAADDGAIKLVDGPR
jgi:hypothetical protein